MCADVPLRNYTHLLTYHFGIVGTLRRKCCWCCCYYCYYYYYYYYYYYWLVVAGTIRRDGRQDAGVCNLRLRPVLEARSDRPGTRATQQRRPGQSHRGVARHHQSRQRSRKGKPSRDFQVIKAIQVLLMSIGQVFCNFRKFGTAVRSIRNILKPLSQKFMGGACGTNL